MEIFTWWELRWEEAHTHWREILDAKDWNVAVYEKWVHAQNGGGIHKEHRAAGVERRWVDRSGEVFALVRLYEAAMQAAARNMLRAAHQILVVEDEGYARAWVKEWSWRDAD